MQFVHVDPARIEREWPVIVEILAPAAEHNPSFTLLTLRSRLIAGSDHLFRVDGDAEGYIALELSADLCCWIKCAAGRVRGGPKARVKTIRGIIAFIEKVSREAGCSQIKFCGRAAWRRILPDYQPLSGHRNGLKKEL